MLRGFIENSPDLKSSLKSATKAPYHKIELRNGSIIKGFTAGTRSGAGAGSVRGQAGDWIYMDEVDYMSDADFETVYAVAADQATKGVWISSTPTGRRGKFWIACNDKNVWTEFYFPSMVNPGWGPKMEADFKSQLTDQGYIHEVLAEFGEETVGVFKKEYIDRAKANLYEYAQLDISGDPIAIVFSCE
jgi:replicative DNA helicase